jgi:hypothetical protein
MYITQGTKQRAPATWQMVLCFLLALLFLYNPFLNSHRESGDLTVGHPASHRATVGSSELEQFLQGNGAVAPLLDLDVAQFFIEPTDATLSTTFHATDYDEGTLPQPGFSSSLWTRPPPAVQ